MAALSNRTALGDLTNALPPASLATPAVTPHKRPLLKLPDSPATPHTSTQTSMKMDITTPPVALSDPQHQDLFQAASIVTQPTPRIEPPSIQTPSPAEKPTTTKTKGWTVPTHPKSPNFIQQPHSIQSSTPVKKSTTKTINWTVPTRPKSPNFRLSAHFAKTQTPPTPPNPNPKKRALPPPPSLPTHPKSPKLLCATKPPSAHTQALKAAKARAHAAELAHQARLRQRQQKIRQTWHRTRTVPKSPAVLRHHRQAPKPAPPVPRFVPVPRPSFLDDEAKRPVVRETRASAARASIAAAGGRQAVPVVKPRKKTVYSKPKATIPDPFPLQGVDRHDVQMIRLRAQQQQEEDMLRRRRNFQPTRLSTAMLDAPTFVPNRSDVPLTRPASLLPHAEERTRRTKMFQARQQERMEELERGEEIAKREREAREEREAHEFWRQNRFQPRLVPTSHYNPQILGSIGYEGSFCGEESELGSVQRGGQLLEDDSGFPSVEDKTVKRGNIFDNLRRSLEPLLGITSPPPSGEVGGDEH